MKISKKIIVNPEKQFEEATASILKGPPDDLAEFETDDSVPQKQEFIEYKKVIEIAKDERPIQKFFEQHPSFLTMLISGGHGRWAIPQKKLGSEFIPDFVIGEKSSLGYEWYLVELESPKFLMFKNNGDQSAYLSHAIDQINKWRVWLEKNIDYATRKRENSGLGLLDINGTAAGFVFIGRRRFEDEKFKDFRRKIGESLNIRIHSYDYFLNFMSNQ